MKISQKELIRQTLHQQVIALTRFHKKIIMLLADILMLPLALWTAFALRLSDWWPEVYLAPSLLLFLLITPLGVLIFARLGLYRAVVRFMGVQAVWAVLKGALLLSALLYLFSIVFQISPFPRSVPIIFAMVALLYVGGSRFFVRNYYRWLQNVYSDKQAVLIYGAGYAGVELATALERDPNLTCIGFVDDDASMQGTFLAGKRVHSSVELDLLVAKNQVTHVLLALPSASLQERKEILDRLSILAVHVKTVPTYQELVSGEATLSQLREVAIDDLLGRESVPPDTELLSRSVNGRVVMITGAGGSIGSELARKVLDLAPTKIILFDQSEFNLYAIEKELLQYKQDRNVVVPVVAILGSVLDQNRVRQVMTRFEVSTVYHAAAYKHVPLVEHNVIEGIRNNIFGTKAIADAAVECGVDRCILISTDKAVRPTNVMGASKRFAELILQDAAVRQTSTVFSMVRFGNVLGSSGSVVPLFRQQIENGGPVTVTHKDVIRYFMTIPEAASLVIQAGSMAKGGEVFLLDMGEPVSIDKLARRMINLMGHEVASAEQVEGIEIEYTGLRPGEKLYEELLLSDSSHTTEHPAIAQANEAMLDPSELSVLLSDLESACHRYDGDTINQLLCRAVQEYQPEKAKVDWLLT